MNHFLKYFIIVFIFVVPLNVLFEITFITISKELFNTFWIGYVLSFIPMLIIIYLIGYIYLYLENKDYLLDISNNIAEYQYKTGYQDKNQIHQAIDLYYKHQTK